jgi:uncharacterized membrane protein
MSRRLRKKKARYKENNKSIVVSSNIPTPINPPQSPNTVSVARTTAYAEFSSGPIPDPERLARYNEVLPGAANRIITMAENQAAHRQGLEKKVIHSDNFRATLGVICGLVITLAALACGSYLIINGHDWAGATIIITDLAVLVGVFVYGTQSRREERKTKSQQIQLPLPPKR